MTQEGFMRKLTTIFSADAVGYSRLMGDDEAATVRTIELYRRIIGDLVTQHRGRVIDSPGDNLLAEFGSVVDAVQCAVAVQKELASRNAGLSDDRQMKFRIGVNLGDVIQEGERIYGDGVNIAARLEALAEPGGICISKTAFDHIESKLPLGYEYIGDQTVKNIAKPVKAYRVSMEPRVTQGKSTGGAERTPILGKPAFFGLATIFLIAVAYGLWALYARPPALEPTSVAKMAFPLPDKPSIAVLPFDNMSDDPQQEYFCDGLTEEIITALSRVPKLFVIARNSVFTYKGKAVKVGQVAEELGVRYVLEGSIRKSEDQVRINVQLIDALSGHHLWANRYERSLKEIFAVQDELTKNIVTAMQVKLTEGEQARAEAKGTDNLEAYLKCLQAREETYKFNIESNAMGRELAQAAIKLDPDYAMAYAALAMNHQMDVWLGTSKSPPQSLAASMELLQKAIALEPTYAEAYADLGFTFTILGKFDQGVATARQGVAYNPNSAKAHMMLGHTLRFAGRHEEAIPEYKKAIRLNPMPPTNYLFGIGLSYCWLEQYDEAIKWCEKAVRDDPDSFLARLMLTVVYSRSGRLGDARAEASEVLRINPGFSVDEFEKGHHGKDKALFIGALKEAGLK